MARAIHGVDAGGSLKALAERYGIGEKGDEVVKAENKFLKDFTREELAQYGEYCKNDVELTYELFKIFEPKFKRVEYRLIDMTCRMHSEPKLTLDIDVLQDHLYRVKKDKEDLLTVNGVTREDLMSNEKFADLLRNLGVTPPMKDLKPTKKNPDRKGKTFAFAKTDDGFKELQEHTDFRVRNLCAARLGHKSTLEEKRTERFLNIVDECGGLPVPLKYYGAMTGRWAAVDKINLQNIPRGSMLKKAIIVEPDHVIVGADLSNIELRVGLYFAGQMDKVDLLGSGADLYKDFASSVFDVPYEEVDDDQRFIGKTSQLSLIYGVGAEKIRAAIKQGSGKDIGADEAKRIVGLYREEYSKVKAAWDKGKDVLDWMWANSEETFGENGTVNRGMFGGGPLRLDVYNLCGINLPSDMFLNYPDLQKYANTNEMTYHSRQGRVRIYGAKCFQNTVQALARCVMGEAMVRIHERYPVALTIHDAVYCVVPEAEAEEARRFIITELRKEPAWAPGIPLDAEGGYGKNLSFKMTKL
jgi:DNA polymerase